MRTALVALLLAGCQTVPAPQVVVGTVKPIEIRVPVVQPCIEPSKIEALPATSMPPRTADIEALANGAAADLLRYRELARKQNEMLLGCSKLTGDSK